MARCNSHVRAIAVLALSTSAAAGDCYGGVDATSPDALRSSLHELIDDHQRYPYTSTSTDTWNILELADEDPLEPLNIRDVYKNESYAKVGAGNGNYQREHTWPSSCHHARGLGAYGLSRATRGKP